MSKLGKTTLGTDSDVHTFGDLAVYVIEQHEKQVFVGLQSFQGKRETERLDWKKVHVKGAWLHVNKVNNKLKLNCMNNFIVATMQPLDAVNCGFVLFLNNGKFDRFSFVSLHKVLIQ